MTQGEFTDLIYDTLMQNKQNPQLNLKKVEDQTCLSSTGYIELEYDNENFGIVIVKKQTK